jgi:hypothetical protein
MCVVWSHSDDNKSSMVFFMERVYTIGENIEYIQHIDEIYKKIMEEEGTEKRRRLENRP